MMNLADDPTRAHNAALTIAAMLPSIMEFLSPA